MNGIKGKLWLKIVAFFALLVFAAAAVLSGLAAGWLYTEKVYYDGGEAMMKEFLQDELRGKTRNFDSIIQNNNIKSPTVEKLHSYNVVRTLSELNESKTGKIVTKEDISELAEYFNSYYSQEYTNIAISIKNMNGEVIYQNFVPEEVFVTTESSYYLPNTDILYEFTYYYNSLGDLNTYLREVKQHGYILEAVDDNEGQGTGEYTASVYPKYGSQILVSASFAKPLTVINTTYFKYDILSKLFSMRNWLLPICIVSVIIAFASFVYLISSAGYNNEVKGMTLAWWHKVPFEIYCVICAMLSVGILLFTADYYGQWWGVVGAIILLALSADTVALCATLLINTFVVRCKTGTLFKYTITVGSVMVIWKFLKLTFKNLSYTWRVILTFGGVFFYELLCLVIIALGGYNLGIGLWLVGKIAVGILAILYAVGLGRVSKTCKEISNGNPKAEVNTEFMPNFVKEFSLDLQNIGNGVQAAVDQTMKSERLKTELITNVSHDLKTPLTSIVNYVDILSKQEIKPEEAREYVEVLVRQSQRMKKLIEDLIEASKASSGAISVNLERTNVATLLSQSLAEYGERLENCKLELVLEQPEAELYANIDGRLTWRIFDNLIGNICKYAQPETRVYVKLEEVGPRIRVSFKNISKYQLNISSDELMERFKRGDSSRHTEGSGLGLAIANDLCKLQNIEFKIDIDGDLYKAELVMNRE